MKRMMLITVAVTAAGALAGVLVSGQSSAIHELRLLPQNVH